MRAGGVAERLAHLREFRTHSRKRFGELGFGFRQRGFDVGTCIGDGGRNAACQCLKASRDGADAGFDFANEPRLGCVGG